MKSFKSHIKEVYLPPEINQFKANVNMIPRNPADSMPDHWKRVGNVSDMMGRYGWKLLGNGAYARAYGHSNKNYIIKLFSDDKYYKMWLDFVANHQGNPFVPKLRGKPVKITGDIWAVRMEKLTPLGQMEFGPCAQIMNKLELWQQDRLAEYLEDHNVDHLLHWYDQIFTFLAPYKRALDIHPGNIMRRHDQIVITDPLAELAEQPDEVTWTTSQWAAFNKTMTTLP